MTVASAPISYKKGLDRRVLRRIRLWLVTTIAVAALLSARAAVAADQTVHEVHVTANDPSSAAATSGADPGLVPAQTPSPAADDDLRINPAEPDFTLVSLPTALRVPRFKSAFRVTHRFTQPLNAKFGDVAGNLFGLDSGAQIGLEYRFGIVQNGEVGIHRTSDRTIEFFGQYS